ncbi:hypothetical protein [Flammeovirga sp. SJP92]|uniref:hypothetical protein n=1 Tax=Flammeovirga sp. SJP92 TaxID=1775430 RepID=UPI00079C8997|nr:hypothetical protein [Flammeovirga sp. SJP92]KXX71770.1 hypothetical protein AVL50_03020 [Flammeovirga sp. SJP92]
MKKKVLISILLLFCLVYLKCRFIDTNHSLTYDYCFNRFVYIPTETDSVTYNNNVVNILSFITKRLKITKDELIQGIDNTRILFIIESDGTIKDISFRNICNIDQHNSLELKIRKILLEMPKSIPAKNSDGKHIPLQYEIYFKI